MRSQEEHISPQELASLPVSPEALAAGTPDERQLALHLQQCEDCISLAQTFSAIRLNAGAATNTQAHNPHPAPATWLALAAGLNPNEAAALLAHAANCTPCAESLHEALALLQPDQLDEAETEPIEGLASATPAWQQRIAAQMSAATTQTQNRVPHSSTAPPSMSRSATEPQAPVLAFPKKPRPVWLPYAIAATLVCALALGGTALYRAQHPSDARLLALAYNKQRLSDLRIPGGAAVELYSPTRAANSARPTSSELLQLKLKSQQQFDLTPNDPHLRQTLGEIAIVEHDGEAARRQFEMAEALDPKLPRLKFDLATAYFTLADTNQHPLDYARAIDYFGQYLQDVHQQDAVALFDRGLCWERQAIDTEAVKDYMAALALEKDPGWRKEIEKHLQTLKSRDSSGAGVAPKPADLTPQAFLAQQSASPKEAPGEYELFLDASHDWLPRRGQDPQAAEALRQLAAMGATHGDAWLGDMLKVTPTPAEVAAEQTLAKAIGDEGKSKSDELLTLSADSVEQFKKIGNQPGLLRAQTEHIYGLQTLGRGKDCLAEATPLQKNQLLDHYAWQKVTLLLEESVCHVLQGQYGPGLKEATAAEEIAQSSRLSNLGFRASAFVASGQYRQGRLQMAWRTVISALADCNSLPGSAYRQYQLLVQLERLAGDLNLLWTQTGVAQAAMQAAISSKNHQTAAYAFERLGVLEVKLGANSDATTSFKSADEMLSTLSPGPTTRQVRADLSADRAMLDANERGAKSAAQILAAQEPTFQSSDSFAILRFRFCTEYADLLLKSHRATEAIQQVKKALDDAENKLPTIRTETERQAWADTDSPAYHVLTLALVETGHPDAALRSWEWLRTAPYRGDRRQKSRVATAETTPIDVTTQLPAVPAANPGVLTIVVAKVQDQYLAWSISPDTQEPVRLRRLSVSRQSLRSQSSAFARLCEDPHSSQQDIATLGDVLYQTLIAPFQDQVDRAQRIQLDLDPSLSRIPVAALNHNGHFFGLDRQIVFLPPWWTLSRSDEKIAANQELLPPQARLLIVRESSSDAAARIPNEYDESSDIVTRFPQSQTQPASLHRSGSTLTIFGAPILKTALANADLVHYSGHGLDEDSTDHVQSETNGQTSVPLDPGVLRRCSLAVLSACHTASQREDSPDNVPTFVRIVLSSGASNVVGTQWDVDSAMTRKLMVRFYSELADHQTFAEALRRAQQALQSDPASSHPYFWSAFQLVGQ